MGWRAALVAVFIGVSAGCRDSAPPPQLPDEDYVCATDDDCCVVLDPCRERLLVFTAKNRDQAARAYQAMRPMSCDGAVPPPTEVSCVAGRCQARQGSRGPGSQLTEPHCGAVLGRSDGAR